MTYSQKLSEYQAWLAGGSQGDFDNIIVADGDSSVRLTLGSDGQPCMQFTLAVPGANTKSVDLSESQLALLLDFSAIVRPSDE